MALDPAGHLRIFYLQSLRGLAEKAGFKKLRALTTIREANGLFVARRSVNLMGKHVSGAH